MSGKRVRYTVFFFFNDTATTEIYTLSLHDALPISQFTARRGHLGHEQQGQLKCHEALDGDRKSTRLNSSHVRISYAVFCLKKKKNKRSHCSLQLQAYVPIRNQLSAACYRNSPLLVS